MNSFVFSKEEREKRKRNVTVEIISTFIKRIERKKNPYSTFQMLFDPLFSQTTKTET